MFCVLFCFVSSVWVWVVVIELGGLGGFGAMAEVDIEDK